MTRRQSQLQNSEHEYVLDRLSSYMDGQLPADEHARVEAHLRTCHSCREDLRTLRWTHDLLQEVAPVPVPRSFVIREADIARPRRTRVGGSPLARLQWATALVAMLLILVVTGDVWLGARPSPGGKEPAVPMLLVQTATDRAAAITETEGITTSPAQSESLAESTQAPATPTGAAMLAQEAPSDKAIVATAGPVVEGVGQESESQPPSGRGEEPPQLPTPVPQPGEQHADAAPVVAPPPDGLKSPVARLPWMQAGWRVAEIGLGMLLAGLVIAVVWVRRHKKT